MPDLDLLVIGSGVAGLFGALAAAEAGRRVAIVTKSRVLESNTRYAQGGIAVPIGDGDSPQLHAQDTLSCGGEINDGHAVKTLTDEAQACVGQLMALGVVFDRVGNELAFTREAAHSVARVIHAGGDATGLSIAQGLVSAVERCAIPLFQDRLVSELLQDGDRIDGVEMIDVRGDRSRMHASRVMLASGGAGQLFSRTTNPRVATGDGLALAYRAGAELMDLEFFQFHPTAVAIPGQPAFLISEAARGEGAVLRSTAGRRFVFDYHSDGELAPRDVVARAIWSEMAKEGTESVALDLTHLSASYLQQRFPTIWRFCSSIGLDISHAPIPVSPAAHYFMGGIRTDQNGGTSMHGLRAAGEVACTGVHGANRLASNSLLEGLVFGRRAALAAESVAGNRWGQGATSVPTAKEPTAQTLTRSDLQRLNWTHLGLVRDESGLQIALSLYSGLTSSGDAPNPPEVEDANMILISRLIAQSALMRAESRGAHFRSDHPEAIEEWRGHIIAAGDGIHFEPINQTHRGDPRPNIDFPSEIDGRDKRPSSKEPVAA